MGGRENSDETYVTDLYDVVVGEHGLRQHRFEWLLGDAGSAGWQARLSIAGYWPGRRLAVKYRETQHDKATPFFDTLRRLTVSGVEQGQRTLYAARRDVEIPAHGLRPLVIRPADLDANSCGRLRRRDRTGDLQAVRGLCAAAQGTELTSLTSWASDEDWVVLARASGGGRSLPVRRRLRAGYLGGTAGGGERG
ncbi:hypothetical protein ABZV34_25165 [Streptomyces sp. NPDC005195]|uniref:hypothetical protein n=1 Tax=Streptomyces sp. NPDC005195 TaxID=3154561 RepID=UPI0033B85DBE